MLNFNKRAEMENINVNIASNLHNGVKFSTDSLVSSAHSRKREKARKGDYLFGETIGQGAFAKVKLATHKYTQEKVAIKILDKAKFLDNEKDISRIQKEISILQRLRHKNIIQLYEIIESSNNLYIVMDYCEGKELFDYIIKKNQLSEKKACRFFQQIINGVEYLHLQNITHRDLKPENLLLDSKQNIIISDFGLSYVCDKPDALLQTPCGTPSYAPPEMLRGDLYQGVKSDIWSCGIILYTMLCGNLPCAESKEELIYKCYYNKAYDYPSYLSSSVVDLIKRLLKFHPDDRPTFDQIKRHPWFSLVRPQMKPGLIVDVQKIPIDESILSKVEQLGYDREECRNSVSDNKYDHLSAIYYLILKQFKREEKKSISDMNSDLYDNYIRSYSNWVHPEEFIEKKYKDYWPERGLSTGVIERINAIVSPKHSSMKLLADGEVGCDNSSQCSNHQLTLEKSSSQGNQLTSSHIHLEEFNTSIKITGSNTSINTIVHCPVNPIILNEPTADAKVIASSNCNVIKRNIKQMTFTSSSKKPHYNQSYYAYLLQSQMPLAKLDTDPSELIPAINDSLKDSIKQSLLSKLSKEISSFNRDLKSIDSFNLLPATNGLIPLIAKKLIRTTIFSKHLLCRKPNRPYKDELEEKFYKLQKYKDLVETVKSTRRNIFPKKIYDWNYYTFEVFLNNEEDFIFSDAYHKSNLNAQFISRIKQSIKKNNRLSLIRRNQLTANPHTRSAGPPTFKNHLMHYNAEMSSSKKRSGNYRHFNKRLNRFMLSPNDSMQRDCSGSQSYKSIHQASRDNCMGFPTYGAKYSSSSMNNISEDEEWIKRNDNSSTIKAGSHSSKAHSIHSKVHRQKRIVLAKGKEPLNFLNDKFDIKPRRKCGNNKGSLYSDYLYSPNSQNSQQTDTFCNDISEYNQSIQTISSLKKSHCYYNTSNSNYALASPPRGLNQCEVGVGIRQMTSTSKQKQHIALYPQVALFRSDQDSDDEEGFYCGPVDFRCVFQASKDVLIGILRQYFKQKEYFCKSISEYAVKCYKANVQYEFQMMTLKGTAMTYIRIRKRKGGNREYVKVIKGLLNSFPI